MSDAFSIQRVRTTCPRMSSPRMSRAFASASAGERVPLAAEEVLALAGDLSRALVELEAVERMAGVRHLTRSVLPLGRAEKACLEACADGQLARLDERGPVRGTLAIAGALP